MPLGVQLGTYLGSGGTGRGPIMFLAQGNSLSAQDRNGAVTLTGSGALRYQPGSGGRVNLVPDPSFEGASISTWSKFSSGGPVLTLSQDATTAYSGSKSLKVDCVNVDTTNTALVWQGSILAHQCRITNPSAIHTLSFSAKTDNPNIRVSARMVTSKADGSALLTINPGGNKTLSSDWQRFSVGSALNGVAGAEGVRIQFVIVAASGTESGTVWIDAVQFEQAASATPYFDGSSPGCVWADPITGIAGTAHASPSISRAAFWVEEATTNLLLNPSAEVDTSSIAAFAGSTRSRDTTYAYSGSASVKVVTSSAGANEGVEYVTSGTLNYTGSARTFIGHARVRGTGTLRIRISLLYSDASTATTADVNFTAIDAWQQNISPTITIDPLKTLSRINLDIQVQSSQTSTFYVDAAQIEEKTYATSYCDGSLGAGYSWSGTAHGSASSRAVGSISVEESGRVSSIGSFAGMFARYVDTGLAQRLFDVGQNTAGIDRIFLDVNASDLLQLTTQTNGGGSQGLQRTGALAVNTFYLASASWNGTAVAMAIGSEAPTTGTRTAPQGTFVSGTRNLTLGLPNDVTNTNLDGLLGPVAFFDRALTTVEIATLISSEPSGWWSAI